LLDELSQFLPVVDQQGAFVCEYKKKSTPMQQEVASPSHYSKKPGKTRKDLERFEGRRGPIFQNLELK
jgi:hypothetical protein